MIVKGSNLKRGAWLLALAALAGLASPLAAQGVETVDPDSYAIDGDLTGPDDGPTGTIPAPPSQPASQPTASRVLDLPPEPAASAGYAGAGYADQTATAAPGAAAAPRTTYRRDDLIGAAEGVFGKGAEGLAKLIEDLLRDQGEPNAYIVGREGGGAIVFGVRYGSGTLFHAVEGEKPVYWTGPSIGFDAGANAGSTFVLVYNLWDTEDLYKRYPAGEGQAYLVGGFNASYMRRGDVVLIPIRAGAGLRLGINAGYMKFSKKQRWLPF